MKHTGMKCVLFALRSGVLVCMEHGTLVVHRDLLHDPCEVQAALIVLADDRELATMLKKDAERSLPGLDVQAVNFVSSLASFVRLWDEAIDNGPCVPGDAGRAQK